MSIFDKSSELKQPRMFFGDGHFIQEFLKPAYPWALKSVDQQNKQDWAFDEFSLKLDAAQLSSANNAIRHIFTSNLQSQVFADTIQGRGPSWLIPYISDPSIEYMFTQWSRFECLTDDHEVLVQYGDSAEWLSIADMSVDYRVVQWEGDNVSFANPTHTLEKEYSGTMYHIYSEGVYDQFVTENHRIPVKGGEVLAKDLSGVFELPYIKDGTTQYVSSDKVTITTSEYDGTVYCITVPSSYFVVRRNGVVSVTGNCLHSRSYTHILTSMYPNPRIVLDMIEQKPEVFSRFSQCTRAYDNFFEDPSKENLIFLIAAINILEGLAFYASFICNFSFANNGMFESVSKYLKLISKDEALHLGITQQIIKTWRTGKDGKEWKDLWNKNKEKVRDMYVDAIQEEYAWSKYLFQYGTPIVGLNEDVLNRCIEYYANKRMKNIGLKEYNGVNKDPLPWVQTKYLSTSGFQDAPQEVSITSYFKDSIQKMDNPLDLKSLFVGKINEFERKVK